MEASSTLDIIRREQNQFKLLYLSLSLTHTLPLYLFITLSLSLPPYLFISFDLAFCLYLLLRHLLLSFLSYFFPTTLTHLLSRPPFLISHYHIFPRTRLACSLLHSIFNITKWVGWSFRQLKLYFISFYGMMFLISMKQ